VGEPDFIELGSGEWRRFAAAVSALPITCDPDWAGAVERAYAGRYHARAWQVRYRGGDELLVGYEELGLPGLPRLTLSPFGLGCALACADGPPSYAETLVAFRRAKGWRYRSISFHLPFDAASDGVREYFTIAETATHVLDLDAEYDKLFEERMSGKTRTSIRRAQKVALRVEMVRRPEDARSYYAMHRALADQRGGYGELHPERLFVELLKVPRCELSLVYSEDLPLAGGVFFEDGDAITYWHGAADRRFVKEQGTSAMLSTMIVRALERGKRQFNFGGSSGIRSLESFKEAWGATRREIVVGSARNPFIAGAKWILRVHP
jgi:hypothetical protein